MFKGIVISKPGDAHECVVRDVGEAELPAGGVTLAGRVRGRLVVNGKAA